MAAVATVRDELLQCQVFVEIGGDRESVDGKRSDGGFGFDSFAVDGGGVGDLFDLGFPCPFAGGSEESHDDEILLDLSEVRDEIFRGVQWECLKDFGRDSYHRLPVVIGSFVLWWLRGV